VEGLVVVARWGGTSVVGGRHRLLLICDPWVVFLRRCVARSIDREPGACIVVLEALNMCGDWRWCQIGTSMLGE
jgi:hypothetical protein